MGTRKTFELTALGVLDERFDLGSVNRALSVWDDANPEPGNPIAPSGSRVTISGHGEQTALDVDVLVSRGGAPGTLEAGYSEAGEPTLLWSPPMNISELDSLLWTTSASGCVWHAAVALPRSQRVVLLYKTATASLIQRRLWSPRTRTWSSAANAFGSSVLNPEVFALWANESDEVFCVMLGAVYISRDEGASWSLYSSRAFPEVSGLATSAWQFVAAQYHPPTGDVLVMVTAPSATTKIAQFASRDGGGTFELVWSSTTSYSKMNLAATAGGSIVVGYVNSSAAARCRRLPGAFASFDDYPDIPVAGATVQDMTLFAEADGYALWSLTRRGRFGEVGVSYDDGATWSVAGSPALNTDDNDTTLARVVAAYSCGEMLLLATHAANPGTYDNSLVCLRSSGWETLSAGVSAATAAGLGPFNDRPHQRYGNSSASGSPAPYGRTFLPFDLPGDQGLTVVSSGTFSQAISASEARIEHSTTAGTLNYEIIANPAEATMLRAQFDLQVMTGSSLSSDLFVASLKLCTVAATNNYHALCRIDPTGIVLRDQVAGTTLASVAMLAGDRFSLRMQVEPGGVTAWYRMYGEREWTRIGAERHPLTNTASGSVTFGGWGVAASDTCTWRTYMVQFSCAPARWRDSGSATDAACEMPSRPIGGIPTPVPTLGFNIPLRLSARGSWARERESHRIERSSATPLAAAWVGRSPSPRHGWRSDSDSADIYWDLNDAHQRAFLPHSMALHVARTNQFHWTLQAYNATSATWSNVAVIDTRWVTLPYTRQGDQVIPSGTGTFGRMLVENELAGSYIKIGDWRRIRGNSAGYWTGGDTVRLQARLWVDADPGDDTSGNAEICPHSFCFVLSRPFIGGADHSLWRLRILDTGTTTGLLEVGSLGMFRLSVTGLPYSWGATDTVDLPRNVEEFPGYAVQRKAAPKRRTVSVGWQDQMTEYPWYLSEDGDFLAYRASFPEATFGDVHRLVQALQEGADKPMLLVRRINPFPADTLIREQDLWVVGRSTASAQAAVVSGWEGETASYRLEGVTIEEDV